MTPLVGTCISSPGHFTLCVPQANSQVLVRYLGWRFCRTSPAIKACKVPQRCLSLPQLPTGLKPAYHTISIELSAIIIHLYKQNCFNNLPECAIKFWRDAVIGIARRKGQRQSSTVRNTQWTRESAPQWMIRFTTATALARGALG